MLRQNAFVGPSHSVGQEFSLHKSTGVKLYTMFLNESLVQIKWHLPMANKLFWNVSLTSSDILGFIIQSTCFV